MDCDVNSLKFIPEDMIRISILPAKYKVFNVKGKTPDKLIETWTYIWSEFFSKRTYITDFELYKEEYNSSEVDIYLSIK